MSWKTIFQIYETTSTPFLILLLFAGGEHRAEILDADDGAPITTIGGAYDMRSGTELVGPAWPSRWNQPCVRPHRMNVRMPASELTTT